MKFAEKLVFLRKHHDLSQEIFAERMKTSRATVSRWEAGQTVPDMLQLMQISDMFGVSIDYLVNEKKDEKLTGQISDFRSMRVLFVFCTLINVLGFLIAWFSWPDVRAPTTLLLGILLNGMACVLFEVFQPRGVDRHLARYARRVFYAANVWFIAAAPIFVTEEILTKQLYEAIAPHLYAAAAYYAIAITATVFLLRRYKI